MASANVNLELPKDYEVSAKTKTMMSILMFIGLVAFTMTMVNNPERAWSAYLIGLFYFITLALGGLFFVAIQHMTSAGWSVSIRRLVEAFTAFLPYGFALTIIYFIFGGPVLYDWFHADRVAADHLLAHKASYLNKTFFAIRILVFFGLWLYFAKRLVGSSVLQDKNKDVSLTTKLVKPAIACVMTFAVSYSFFSIDLLMALEPHWFSTIFGVYCFGGMFQSTMAALIILIYHLRKRGLGKGYITDDHLHDIGKFLFAFTVFWAYIAFSQYMLIWYANLPEETIFFKPRSEGQWMWVSLALMLFKFIIPFFALMPRWAKRNINHLVAISCLVLVMQFVDMYWLIYPNLDHHHTVFGLSEIGIFLGFVGFFIYAVTRFLSKNQIVATGDPRLEEALHHHVVY